ncbi:hypothetical protein [Microlunatus parietis]|uniref:Uncharacterized protein n=1 Tax=Microlunatus parietis TaxID=682979 RepID=A0A7Y9IER0_9ACTN|nr:hypothetical protein [Microlunatus parietis]NYE75173.1 hypothetical protein [Microlunatus parietis]
MNFLKRLFGRSDDEESGPDLPITLDVEQRKAQLLRLEQSLDALVAAMKEDRTRLQNPGWRERVAEYGRLAGEAMTQRQATLSRDRLLDLVFEVRPVFTGPIPPELEQIGPLQDEVMAAAEALREVLPGERGGAA